MPRGDNVLFFQLYYIFHMQNFGRKSRSKGEMAELVMAYVVSTQFLPGASFNCKIGQVKAYTLTPRFLMGVIPRGFESHSLQSTFCIFEILHEQADVLCCGSKSFCHFLARWCAPRRAKI
jgi:hypothetical protein